MENIKVISIPKELPVKVLNPTTPIKVVLVQPVLPSSNVTTVKPKISVDYQDIYNTEFQNFINSLSADDYDALLKLIIIRFNTEPRRYEKQDFGTLIKVIIKGYEENKGDLLTLKDELTEILDNKLDKSFKVLRIENDTIAQLFE